MLRVRVVPRSCRIEAASDKVSAGGPRFTPPSVALHGDQGRVCAVGISNGLRMGVVEWYKLCRCRHLNLIGALTEITTRLKVAELLAILSHWIMIGAPNQQISDPEKDRFAGLLLASNAGYHQLLTRPNTSPILHQLKIGEVYEPSRFRTMLSLLSNVPQTATIAQTPQLFVAL